MRASRNGKQRGRRFVHADCGEPRLLERTGRPIEGLGDGRARAAAPLRADKPFAVVLEKTMDLLRCIARCREWLLRAGGSQSFPGLGRQRKGPMGEGPFVDLTRTSVSDAPSLPRIALSWSAGKDACLVWLRLREQGLVVRTFVTMCEDALGPSLSHALPRSWLAAQAAACGVAWRAVDVPRSHAGSYAMAFDCALEALRQGGHTHMAFGDIDLEAHRAWIAPRCEAAGLVPLFPLWGGGRAALADEVIARGIRARIVALDTVRLDARFCGAAYDRALLASLPAGVCPCGEDGEFHTAVTFAPCMSHPVPLADRGMAVVAAQPPLAPTRIARLVFA